MHDEILLILCLVIKRFNFLTPIIPKEYVMAMEKQHAAENKVLSYFELNLETWRQLWRVLEISDIVLVIVDIRYPVRIPSLKLLC